MGKKKKKEQLIVEKLKTLSQYSDQSKNQQ